MYARSFSFLASRFVFIERLFDLLVDFSLHLLSLSGEQPGNQVNQDRQNNRSDNGNQQEIGHGDLVKIPWDTTRYDSIKWFECEP